MKRTLFLLLASSVFTTTFAQTFADTAQLNKYVQDTIRDRRPEKVTAAQIQKAFLGTVALLTPNANTRIDSVKTASNTRIDSVKAASNTRIDSVATALGAVSNVMQSTTQTLTNNASNVTITGLTIPTTAFKLAYRIKRNVNRVSGDEIEGFVNNLRGGATGTVNVVTLQSDGKLLIGGGFTTFNGFTRNGFTRLNYDGTEDIDFLSQLGAAPGGSTGVTAIVVQPDNKIIVGGSFTSLNLNTRNRLLRLNSDGTEDVAFYTNEGSALGGSPTDMQLQSDGKILITGFLNTFNGAARNNLIRVNADGTEDAAFYTNLGTAFGSQTNTVAVQSDGKIIVGGLFTTFNSLTRNRLLRLNSDGTEDAAFYTNLGTGFGSFVNKVLVQPDGKILVLGSFTTLNGLTRNYLVRLNSNGTEDAAFYTNLGTGFSTNPTMIYLQPDGKILCGGNFTTFNGNTRNRVVRLNSDGTEDATFGAGIGTGFNSTVTCFAYQATGSKVIIGGGFTTYKGVSRYRISKVASASFSEDVIEAATTYGTASNGNYYLGQRQAGIGLNSGVTLSYVGGVLKYTSSNLSQNSGEITAIMEKL